MKLIAKSIILSGVLLAGMVMASCDDANEYEDARTDNPSFVVNYTDSTEIQHPETIANTTWVRASGIKYNAFGQEIQGYVESLAFENDSVVVKMSEPATVAQLGDGASAYTWTDDSNSEATPKYAYVYSSTTGRVEISKLVKDDKGNVSPTVILSGIFVSGTLNGNAIDVLTVSHFSDTPVQTYLVRQ